MIEFLLSCDLLEKSYLCGIQNNYVANLLGKDKVVICLKNRTFAVYKTTYLEQSYTHCKL